MLKLEQVSKIYEGDRERTLAIENISFEVKDGEFYTLIGPSGCGKSTLLRVISDLIAPTSGKLIWDESPRIGFVFQNFALFPYLTVEENIEFGLKMQGVGEAKRKKVVEELISELELNGFEKKHPKELSGGMKQRVGIARALAVDPNVLLLDEPFSSLDEFTAETLRKLLHQVWQRRKITIIMVTHLISEAIELADKIVVFTPRPGRVEQIVENNLHRPRNLRSKDFFDLEDKLKLIIKV